ncbi:MAG: hypothetical protein ACRDHF_10725 [Tepidiformaceae bacterium]
MDTWVIVAIVAAAILVVVVVLALWAYLRNRRSTELRDTFGPEYDRVVRERGRGAGEKELTERRDRVKVFEMRPLSREQHSSFTRRWSESQARFVDDPSTAITEADVLVTEVMEARGYPVADDFDRRAADISVDHPDFVANYRAAHDVSTRHATGEATTEELRRAMVNYRELFSDLLDTGVGDRGPGDARVPASERHA